MIMKMMDILIPELDREVELTETFLKRIPEDKLNWRPHKKSMTLKELGSHLAEIPVWVTATMEQDELSMDDYQPPQANSVSDMVSVLQRNAAEARKALQKDDSEYFDKTWKMVAGGHTIFELPKYQTLRGMVLNQLPHHRAQLGLYLRLLNESVPATYGPSADER